MQKLKERAAELRKRTRAANTRIAYESDWIQFTRWCTTAGRTPLPATSDTLALYTASIAGVLRPSTATRHLISIRAQHIASGLSAPDTAAAREVIAGAARSTPLPSAAKKAITVEQLRQISRDLEQDGSKLAIRDRAAILFGFSSGMRREEIASLTTSDLEESVQGLTVRIRKSKTDQLHKGRTINVFRARKQDLCPVRALKLWLRVRGKQEGPLFTKCTPAGEQTNKATTGRQILRAVQRAIKRIGLDPAEYGAHSLRAGMVTAALESGAQEALIMLTTGHQSHDTLRRYVRPEKQFKANPLAKAL